MSERVKVEIDVQTGKVSVECSEEALDKVFEKVELLLPTMLQSLESDEDSEEEEDDTEQPEEDNVTDEPPALPNNVVKKPRQKGKPESYKEVPLNLDGDQGRQFAAFYTEKKPTTGREKILTVMYWLTKHGNIKAFDKDIVFSGFRKVGERVGVKISSYLRLMRTDGEVSFDQKAKKYVLEYRGEDLVEHNFNRKEEKK